MQVKPVWSVQLTELKDELQPLVQMVKDGKIPPGKVSIFEHIPQSASDNTCNMPNKPSFVNLDFYFMLILKFKIYSSNIVISPFRFC